MLFTKIFRNYGVLTAMALLGCGVLFVSQSSDTRAASDQQNYQMLSLLGEAYERVRNNYVEDIEDEVLIEAAIKGMMAALDPYSDYLNKDHFDAIQDRNTGQFGGLGIEITLDETGYIRVVSPIDDTPAAIAGIMPNDLITHINDIEITSLSLNQAVEMMRGPIDSEIELKILRANAEMLHFTLERKYIKIRSVRSRVIEEDIGYIRITNFNGQTTKGLRSAVTSLQEKSTIPLQGYIIDLRNNPGGLLQEAVHASDGFLNRGEIVSIRGRDDNAIQRFQAQSGDWTNNQPIAVLINGGSASASEILAGALQDHDRATLIGTSSFGKGSVQTIIPLEHSNAALKLTTQYYYTPSGRSIAKVGLSPDIEVASLPPIKNDDGTLSPPKTDNQLKKAIDFLHSKQS